MPAQAPLTLAFREMSTRPFPKTRLPFKGRHKIDNRKIRVKEISNVYQLEANIKRMIDA